MNDALSTKQQYNVSFVTVIVADMQRSIDFYTKKLGLPLKTRYGDHFAIVEAPGVTIGLHPAKDGGAAPGTLSIGLGVSDVAASREELQGRGLAFDGDIVADPPMRFAFLRDPDGAQLYLAEQSEWV
ncbi:MAG: VOC family protein [Candidatus Eremiobacteraeota bacterium]|nr:VOC family protein [Candidatus Eremiobacteraeota bacterium]